MGLGHREGVLFARQPIYNRARELVGFELLFRDSAWSDSAPAQFDDNEATSQVLVKAFTEGNIAEVCSHKPAFVNFSAETLRNVMPFSPDQLVIEVLESVVPTDEILEILARLRENGYRVAIDDFVESDPRHALLEHADIVKLEYPQYTVESLIRTCAKLRQTHPELTLLAEKVETQADFDRASAAGCDLFQGYFLARPQTIHGQSLPVSRMNVVQLLGVLNDPSSSTDDIVQAMGGDPALSIRLLKLVNSAVYYGRKVTSLQMAIMALGTIRIHAYANLLALSQLDDTPAALRQLAATRGFVCQSLCERLPVAPEMGFTTGLFSCLDVLIGCDLETLLASVPLDDDIQAALIRYTGLLGLVLSSVVTHEEGRVDDIRWSDLERVGINRAIFMAAFEQGVLRANEMSMSTAL